MLWIKSLHLIFVISWFAGLFYLPRIFVNLAMAKQSDELARLNLMAHKLYRFMTPLGILALIFGVWTWGFYDFYMGEGWRWMHAKLALVAILVGYHIACRQMLLAFAANKNTRSHVWFRFFNEIPVLILFAIVILVIVKPF